MNSFCEKSSHGAMLQEGSHQLNRSGGLAFREVSFRYVTLSRWSIWYWMADSIEYLLLLCRIHILWLIQLMTQIVHWCVDFDCHIYWWQMATFESIQSVYHQNWMQIVDLIRSCSNWWKHFLLIIGGFLVDFERGSSRIDHWWIDPDRSIAKRECG